MRSNFFPLKIKVFHLSLALYSCWISHGISPVVSLLWQVSDNNIKGELTIRRYDDDDHATHVLYKNKKETNWERERPCPFPCPPVVKVKMFIAVCVSLFRFSVVLLYVRAPKRQWKRKQFCPRSNARSIIYWCQFESEQFSPMAGSFLAIHSSFRFSNKEYDKTKQKKTIRNNRLFLYSTTSYCSLFTSICPWHVLSCCSSWIGCYYF